MQEVWLVYVVYQYDGYENTEVYSTKEKACEAAHQLVFEFEEDGYTIIDDVDVVFAKPDGNWEWDYITLANDCGEVEIIVEKKIVR